jgi:ABC-2 type transport system ATP-binding protein
LRVLATLGNIPSGRIPDLLKTVGLSGRERDLVGGYSLGMKQRLGVAAALLPNPDLLVLDEPANGLDPEGIMEMRELLRTLHADGKTIFVSSHLLGELEQVADWLVVIRDGKAIYAGPTRDLTTRQSDGYLLAPLDPASMGALQQLTDKLGFPSVLEDGYLRVTATRDAVGQIAQEAMKAGISLAEMRPVQATLEQTFLDMIAGDSDV